MDLSQMKTIDRRDGLTYSQPFPNRKGACCKMNWLLPRGGQRTRSEAEWSGRRERGLWSNEKRTWMGENERMKDDKKTRSILSPSYRFLRGRYAVIPPACNVCGRRVRFVKDWNLRHPSPESRLRTLCTNRKTLHQSFQPEQEPDPPAVCHHSQGLDELVPVRQFLRRETVFQDFILEFL